MKKLKYVIGLFFFIFLMSSCSGKKNRTYSSTKTKTTTKPSSSSTPKAAGTSTSKNSKVNKAVKTAKSYIGTKYRYGGMDRKGMDCSGLMCVSYKSAGITIPRTTRDQNKIGRRVYIGELAVGDLVFFGSSPSSQKITHVGMISYVSKSSIKFIHASTKAGVVQSELLSNWYKPRYIKAVRPLK